MIDSENPVRVIDAYIDSLDLLVLGFKEYESASMFIAYNLKRLLSMYSVQALSEKFKRRL